jgi:protocatechuate 3,4-dioxygenase alpha subunit
MRRLPTPSQTVGPFWHIGLSWLAGGGTFAADIDAPRITIAGRVLDGDRAGVSDALLEFWQASPSGKCDEPRFRGFTRVPTDEAGAFQFNTIKPGAIAGANGGMQAPHLLVSIFMRGLLKRLVTRMYFADEPRNADDAVLRSVPAARRPTLVARPRADGVLEWNVLLQGEDETVFFDC